MGKMKALLIEMEENGQQQQQEDDFDVVMEEMHYINTINDFAFLIEVYGWTQVVGDLRERMGNRAWQ